jgi:2-deoxy-D-gluconate 3-dehydrogenase
MHTKESFDLSGKTALVVGGGGGIGRKGALALAGCGARVVVADMNLQSAQKVSQEISEAGGEAQAAALDLTDQTQVIELVEHICSEQGSIDILLNSAGISVREAARDFSLDDWNKVLGVNLTGMFIAAQAVGRKMIERRSGKIIHISSLSAHLAHPGNLAYAAAKHGLTGMSKVMAVEWAPYRVNVNCIAPGVVRTPLTEKVLQDPAVVEAIQSKIPMGRLGTTDDLAGTIIFLASGASDFITGQTIYVDGGRILD